MLAGYYLAKLILKANKLNCPSRFKQLARARLIAVDNLPINCYVQFHINQQKNVSVSCIFSLTLFIRFVKF